MESSDEAAIRKTSPHVGALARASVARVRLLKGASGATASCMRTSLPARASSAKRLGVSTGLILNSGSHDSGPKINFENCFGRRKSGLVATQLGLKRQKPSHQSDKIRR